MSLFITFEGIDGSGKSTQAKMLGNALQALNQKHIMTREPGGTELAESIRALVLSKSGIDDPMTELLLISAARRDHYFNLIKPSLEQRITVISDRFFDSSIIYQGILKGLGAEAVMAVTKIAIGDMEPDLTFLLDSDPDLSVKRINHRAEVQNVYDSQSIDLHHKVRNGFLEIAHSNQNRVKIINADRDIEEIAEEIKLIAIKEMK